MTDQVNADLPNAQYQHTSKKLEIGLMGHFFGDATEKPGNVAALAVVLSIAALLLVIFFAPDGVNGPKGQAITLFGSVITGAIGFLFGRKS